MPYGDGVTHRGFAALALIYLTTLKDLAQRQRQPILPVHYQLQLIRSQDVPLTILKVRLEKGEISAAEYEGLDPCMYTVLLFLLLFSFFFI